MSAEERGEAGLRIFRPGGGATAVDPINATGVESEELVVGTSLFMKREVVAPRGSGNPHYHPTTTIVVMLRGTVRVDYGPELEFTDYAETGECLFIPPLLPHRPANDSETVTVECLVIRDSDEEEIIPFSPQGKAE